MRSANWWRSWSSWEMSAASDEYWSAVPKRSGGFDERGKSFIEGGEIAIEPEVDSERAGLGLYLLEQVGNCVVEIAAN